MITLITGSPGSGKTLYCIDKIIQPLIGKTITSLNDDGTIESFPRSIYTNINGLLLDHELIDGDWLLNIQENKKPGIVVVFDEVQRIWPNRPAGTKKLPSVEYLETHRHDGIDIVILTQNPMLLDPAVRALVGRHLHMRRIGNAALANVYEWDSCSNALNFRAAFTKTIYRYNKNVYKLYKSARLHTKLKRKLPFVVWMILLGFIGLAFSIPRFANILDKTNVAELENKPFSGNDFSSTSSTINKSNPIAGMDEKTLTLEEYVASVQPRITGLKHTAPRYDQLTQPTRVPVPAACIASKSRGCTCWDQDAVKMNVPEITCQGIVQTGMFIDFVPERMERDKPYQHRTGGAPVDAEMFSSVPAG
uniref:ZOT protein n=1 Tax=Dulem virus 61 TaxID=3145772 RepID=A0AAU8B8C6_9VIRU